MKIRISTIDNATFLSLWDKKEKLGEEKVAENRRVSLEFLPKLDKLLKKGGLDVREIKKIEMDSNISASFTTGRIIGVIKNILDFARRKR